MNFKLTKGKIISVVLVLAVVIGSFFMGPDLPQNAKPDETTGETQPIIETNVEEPTTEAEKPEESVPVVDAMVEDKGGETEIGEGAVADDALTPLEETPKKVDELPTEAEPQEVKEDVQEVPTQEVKEDVQEVPSQEVKEDTVEDQKDEKGLDQYLTSPVPDGKPSPVEPENIEISDTPFQCTMSIACDAILDNMDDLNPEKAELVPEDGVIYETKTVTFYEGESVFNVLQREMKLSKTHLEFVHTPIYNSAYIEGIHNLYEFDCGELSGWMYRVNDWFPNYGCSRYVLQDGDVIEWIFTCDLGRDIGGPVGNY